MVMDYCTHANMDAQKHRVVGANKINTQKKWSNTSTILGGGHRKNGWELGGRVA